MLLFLLFHIPRTTFTTIGGIPPPQEIIVISRVITREKFFFQKKFLRQKYVTFFIVSYSPNHFYYYRGYTYSSRNNCHFTCYYTGKKNHCVLHHFKKAETWDFQRPIMRLLFKLFLRQSLSEYLHNTCY